MVIDRQKMDFLQICTYGKYWKYLLASLCVFAAGVILGFVVPNCVGAETTEIIRYWLTPAPYLKLVGIDFHSPYWIHFLEFSLCHQPELLIAIFGGYLFAIPSVVAVFGEGFEWSFMRSIVDDFTISALEFAQYSFGYTSIVLAGVLGFYVAVKRPHPKKLVKWALLCMALMIVNDLLEAARV
ncbi:MAG: hypothetical protein PHH26_01445 [Candidatus Thermoplasmatota archaeon]|nr:hypothetical protein [Candidatus Thermoplasmatota archaeon]